MHKEQKGMEEEEQEGRCKTRTNWTPSTKNMKMEQEDKDCMEKR